jgi:hypothetical protein
MKSLEYNLIEPVFLRLDNKLKNKCLKNNIDYWDYQGVFVRILLVNYIKYKNSISDIHKLDFSDRLKVKAVLNKAQYSSKQNELDKAQTNLIKAQTKLFKWLDKTKDPYYFILNPIYNYGAGSSYKSNVNPIYGYLKDRHTGIQNLSIAIDYANYKINNR